MDDLDDFLKGDETPVEAVEPQQEPEATEAPQEAEKPQSGQPRAPDGKFAPKGNDDGAMPAPEDNAKHVPIQSYQAEKQKRQEWEERYRNDVEQLRKELETLKQPKEPEAPPPDFWEDTQGWQQHFGGQVTSQAVQQATLQAKLQMSEMMARQNEKFSADYDRLNEWLGQNPSVVQQAIASAHPWDHAYKAFTNYTTMQELGATDLDSLKAQLLEQLKAEQAAVEPARPAIPQSLAGEQSSQGRGGTPSGPLSLDEILGNR